MFDHLLVPLDMSSLAECVLPHAVTLARASVKGHYQAYPLAGMSCAIFEIPKSQKVVIMGGSETTGWLTDNAGFDNQYSFRKIRTTVVSGR